jgi:hypothetical protein
MEMPDCFSLATSRTHIDPPGPRKGGRVADLGRLAPEGSSMNHHYVNLIPMTMLNFEGV